MSNLPTNCVMPVLQSKRIIKTVKIKAQLKSADRLKARYVAYIGDDELKNNTINLKFMATGEQVHIDLAKLVEQFKKLQA